MNLRKCEDQWKEYENECLKLRGMLTELLNLKHVGNPTEYVEIEEKTVEQSMMLQELNKKNIDLNDQLTQKIHDEIN